jgi:DNA gyrase subunit A
MATKNGVIKKTPLQAYSNPRVGGIIALNLDQGDKLIRARLSNGNQEILIGTKKGLSIRFQESEARPIGRVGRGVRGILLEKGNEVIGMEVVEDAVNTTILTVTEHGYGKRTGLEEYRQQGRGGKGIISIKTTPRNGNAVAVLQVADDDELMLMTAQGKILRLKVSGIRAIGRNTQGVKLIEMDENDRVVGVAHLAEKEEDGPGHISPSPGDGNGERPGMQEKT